jgi:hypothetical protein
VLVCRFCLAFSAFVFAVFAFDETYNHFPKEMTGVTAHFGQFLGSKILNFSTHKTQRIIKHSVVIYITIRKSLRYVNK